jgi:hypothetical protein
METTPEEMQKMMGNMNINQSMGDYDVIKKPRTNFSNNVLRRAVPKINIQDKISSISSNNLNVLS